MSWGSASRIRKASRRKCVRPRSDITASLLRRSVVDTIIHIHTLAAHLTHNSSSLLCCMKMTPDNVLSTAEFMSDDCWISTASHILTLSLLTIASCTVSTSTAILTFSLGLGAAACHLRLWKLRCLSFSGLRVFLPKDSQDLPCLARCLLFLPQHPCLYLSSSNCSFALLSDSKRRPNMPSICLSSHSRCVLLIRSRRFQELTPALLLLSFT